MQICNEIKEIIESKLQLKTERMNENTHFFGKEMNIKPYDLVYLVYLIEEKFKIRFLSEDMDCPGFYTVKGLAEIVLKRMV